MNLSQVSWAFRYTREPEAAPGSRCATGAVARRDVVEVVADVPSRREGRAAILRARDGRFALVRIRHGSNTETTGSCLVSESLERLMNLLGKTELRRVRLAPELAPISQRLDEVARLLGEARAAEARELGHDALVELEHHIGRAPAAGYGARPVLAPARDAAELATCFDQAARELRRGNDAVARGVARDALVQLADLLGLAEERRLPWERPSSAAREPALADAFFQPGAAPEAVLRGCRALLDPRARDRDRSHGEVRSPELLNPRTGHAERGGLLCERTFGPLERLRCACGKHASPEDEGTVCDKCGVLCGSPELRDRRFGHIVVDGVIHPAMEAPIAELLGWTPRDVHDVAVCDAWVEGDRVRRHDVEAPPGTGEEEQGNALPVIDDYSTTGIAVIKALLQQRGVDPTDLILEHVPVLPPGDRPDIQQPGRSLVRVAGVPLTSPVTVAYQRLVNRAQRHRRLVELDAPEIILRNEERAVQRALSQLIERVAAGPGEEPPVGWSSGLSEPRVIALTATEEPTDEEQEWASFHEDAAASPRSVTGALWVDERRLLVSLPRVTLVLDPRSGAAERDLPTEGLRPRFTDGRRVVFMREHGLLDVEVQDEGEGEGEDRVVWNGVQVLDLRTGRWLDRYPDHLPAVAVEKDQPEDALLVDGRRGRTRNISISDRPGLYAYSRDGRFVWIGDGGDGGVILDCETATRQALLEALDLDRHAALVLTAEGELIDPEDHDDTGDASWSEGTASALCFVEDHNKSEDEGTEWRVVTPKEGVVGGSAQTYFTLGFACRALAFSPDGGALAACTGDTLWILEVADPPRVLRRVDLRPLINAVAGGQARPS